MEEHEVKQLNKAELAGLNHAAQFVQEAREILRRAEAQQVELCSAVGLASNRNYRISAEGVVFELGGPDGIHIPSTVEATEGLHE